MLCSLVVKSYGTYIHNSPAQQSYHQPDVQREETAPFKDTEVNFTEIQLTMGTGSICSS